MHAVVLFVHNCPSIVSATHADKYLFIATTNRKLLSGMLKRLTYSRAWLEISFTAYLRRRCLVPSYVGVDLLGGWGIDWDRVWHNHE